MHGVSDLVLIFAERLLVVVCFGCCGVGVARRVVLLSVVCVIIVDGVVGSHGWEAA